MAGTSQKAGSGPIEGETSVTVPPGDASGDVPLEDVPLGDVPSVDVDGELPLLIALAVKAMVAQVSEKAGPTTSGLTIVHGIAVRYLERHVEVTTAELATHLRVTKQSASEIVA